MDNELLRLQFSLFGVAHVFVLTGWKLIGYLGVGLFAGRWFVQMIASGKRKKPTFPTLFWLMSLSGSVLLLIYFTMGRNDSVGIVSNLFPALVSGYNLFLDITYRKRKMEEAKGSPADV